MTREGFKDFLNAAEHSSALRREINQCKDKKSLLTLAKRYGFPMSVEDLEEDFISSQIDYWFKSSRMKPLKR